MTLIVNLLTTIDSLSILCDILKPNILLLRNIMCYVMCVSVSMYGNIIPTTITTYTREDIKYT